MSTLAQRTRTTYENAKKSMLAPFETKSGTPERKEETKDRFDRLMDVVTKQSEQITGLATTVEALRSTADEAEGQQKKTGGVDVITTDKQQKQAAEATDLAKVRAELNEMKTRLADAENKSNRPLTGGGNDKKEYNVSEREHKAAFDQFVRTGQTTIYGELAQKDMQISQPNEGGYAVPEHLDRDIFTDLMDESPYRGVMRTIRVGTSDWKKLMSKGGTSSGWVGETDLRPETDTPELAEVAPTVGTVYANPSTTQDALDDIFYDVEGFLREEVLDEFSEQEGIAFVSGDGVKKPDGFLSSNITFSTDPDNTRAFDQVQKISTGGAVITGDACIDAAYALRGPHRRKASWLANSLSIGTVMKLKNNDGDYIWQQGLKVGDPDRLVNLPIVFAEEMPDIAAGTMPLAVGNWKRAYFILDRFGVRVLRNPYKKEGWVNFYTTKRIGGSSMDRKAYKVLECA